MKAFSTKKFTVAGISGGFIAIGTLWHNTTYGLLTGVFTVEQITALVVTFLLTSAAFLIAATGSAIINTRKFFADRFTL